MAKNRKLFIIALALFILTIPYSNCSNVDSKISSSDSGSSGLGGTSITINSPNPYGIPVDVQIFAVQGECNTGIYSLSEIFWTITNTAGVVISDSYSAGGSSFLAKCQANNRYQINARVPCPGAINTPGGCFGLSQSFTLRVHLLGLTANGTPAQGSEAISPGIELRPL